MASDDLRQAVRHQAGRAVRRAVGRVGYQVVRSPPPEPPGPAIPPDIDPQTRDTIRAVQPYTLTTPERIAALCDAVRYVERASVPGALVECGVWRGGSMLAVARTLVQLGVTDRDLYLFDTFSHMPKPTEVDVHVGGATGQEIWDEADRTQAYPYLPMEQVEDLLRATGYPPGRLHLVPGLVEDTLHDAAPAQLALCRLDTDWYASTRHELEVLGPRLSPGGVLLIDDYGEYLGARQAVDEYLEQEGRVLLLHRIDTSGRIAVVPGR